MAIALLVFTPSSALAHVDAHAQPDQALVQSDDPHDDTDIFSHCHGGAYCGVETIVGVTAVSFSYLMGKDGLPNLHDRLSNLVAHKFDPPPPKNLS